MLQQVAMTKNANKSLANRNKMRSTDTENRSSEKQGTKTQQKRPFKERLQTKTV